MILRVIRARIGHLMYVSGPGNFGGEEHGWLNAKHAEEHEKLTVIDEKISTAILGA